MGRDSPFARRLGELRAERGVSLAKLGDLAHYSRGFISDLASGKKRPGPATAARLDEALGAGGQLAALAAAERETPRAVVAPRTEQLETLRRQVADTITSSGLTPAAVDGWEQTVHDHGTATRYRPPDDL